MNEETVNSHPVDGVELQPHVRKKYVPNDIKPATNQFFLIVFWMYTTLCVLPLLLVLIVSFTDEETINLNGYSFFPKKLSLGAYNYLLTANSSILRSYIITITVTIVGTLIGLLITACYTYPISRKKFPMVMFFSIFAMITLLFSGGLLPSYILWTNYFHLNNSILALIIPGLLMNGYFILLMRTFFYNSIPSELYEAAEIDGASEMKIFARIALPLSLPVLATIGLFYIVNYWNDWMNSMLYIQGSGNISIQFLLIKLMNNILFLKQNSNAAAFITLTLPEESFKMAMSVVAIGPIILAYPFLQRFFVKGLTLGAIKG